MKDTINFTSQVWQEGDMFVSYNPELEVASCGKTMEKAKTNLKEAVEIFMEETEKMGTLNEILKEAGFVKKRVNHDKIWRAPELLSVEKMSLAF